MEYQTLPIAPTYKVSRCGTSIINTVTGRILKQSPQKIKGKPTGYMYCTILDGLDFYFKRIAVHRLVAMTFISLPPEDKPWINHKDGNKANNHADNLEWSSISANIQHAFDTGLKTAKSGKDHHWFGKPHTKEVKAKLSKAKVGVRHPKFSGYYVVDGVKYPSAQIAANALNTYPKLIWERCKQKPNKWGNFYFEPLKTPVNTE